MLKLDKNRLMPILRDFHILTKLNIAIYNKDKEEIVYFPGNSPFCSYIYGSPAAELCIESNTNAFTECTKTNSPAIYKCPFSIWETIAPLNYSGRIIGYIMLGQALDSQSPEIPDPDAMSRIAEKYGLDSGTLAGLRSSLPSTDETYIKSSIAIICTCVSHLYAANIIADKANTFVQHIEEYVTTNLSNDLSVDTLCKAFHLSKAHLHRLFNANFDTTISKYIQAQRMKRAKTMLTTNFSVTETAAAVGIRDYGYFIKVFKKHTGLTPAQYRTQHTV